ncbi:hypothetical protein QJ857_gp1185 [Tupanvirus soda lake]|uniref:Uncharacterized protein n=2 Tax=Tupanvirus TaxID=2094720 RepID=A0A6N1NKV5_9VIRU|nr:hypothetical protein QJ857_gp1185 [Tupanvirus soda lake]QKU34870.1 hypothetical protein [Tupanvirus soda lake]
MSISRKKLNNNRKIFYEKYAKFEVIPHMDEINASEFKNHIKFLTDVCHSKYNKDCFFWTYDEKTNCIIVNDNGYAIENDIFNQFTQLIHWLFSRDYSVKGSYHSRIDNVIESITMDGRSKLVNHYILSDDEPLEIQLGNNVSDDESSKIIIDAKNKIYQNVKFLKSTSCDKNCDVFDDKLKDSSSIENKICNNKILTKIGKIDNSVSCMFVNKVYTAKDEENNIVIKSLQDRLTELENNQKKQLKINKFFLRICTVIGLFTAGSFFFYMSFGKENGISINNCNITM